MPAASAIERLSSFVDVAQQRSQTVDTREQLRKWSRPFSTRFVQVLEQKGRPVREIYSVDDNKKEFYVNGHAWETPAIPIGKDLSIGIALSGQRNIYSEAFASGMPEYAFYDVYNRRIVQGELQENGSLQNQTVLIAENINYDRFYRMWGYAGKRRFDLRDAGIASGILVSIDEVLPTIDAGEKETAIARGEEGSGIIPSNRKHPLSYDELMDMGYRFLTKDEVNSRDAERMPQYQAISARVHRPDVSRIKESAE